MDAHDHLTALLDRLKLTVLRDLSNSIETGPRIGFQSGPLF